MAKICQVRGIACDCDPTAKNCTKRVVRGACVPNKEEGKSLLALADDGNEKLAVAVMRVSTTRGLPKIRKRH